MKHPSQEDLLGYVLGALDAQEQREVQRLIDADPELEERLLEIKSSLAPLDCLDGGASPRPGLARRTSEMVACYQKRLEQEQREHHPITDQVFAEASRAKESPFTESNLVERVSRPGSWSLSDMLVGVAAAAVLAAILLPAVSYTRFQSRVVACQNNLRCLGSAMLTYSANNQRGEFPKIPKAGNSAVNGFYTVSLKEAGLIEDDSVVLCSGRTECNEMPFCIPTKQQFEEASGCRLEYLRKTAGGHYGYTLGYTENNQYHCPSNQGRASFVLLSDMPSQNLEGRRSRNHGGRGQNLLFEDGRVEFVRGHAYGEDPIFENDRGIVAPGAHSGDNVIAPNHLSPQFIAR